MRAGLMRDVLVFEAPVEETTASGARKKTYSVVFQCRAQRKNQKTVGGDEQAKELFLGQMVTFVTRKYPKITYNCRVRWMDCLWEIKLIEPMKDEITLTLKKIDK